MHGLKFQFSEPPTPVNTLLYVCFFPRFQGVVGGVTGIVTKPMEGNVDLKVIICVNVDCALVNARVF